MFSFECPTEKLALLISRAVVIPAEAGIQLKPRLRRYKFTVSHVEALAACYARYRVRWIPASAGMTDVDLWRKESHVS